jgi:hypothetical protein
MRRSDAIDYFYTLMHDLADRGSLAGSHPGGGNYRGSIFRRHVGAALLSQRPAPELLASWLANDPRAGRRNAEREVEVEVSGVIRVCLSCGSTYPRCRTQSPTEGFWSET